MLSRLVSFIFSIAGLLLEQLMTFAFWIVLRSVRKIVLGECEDCISTVSFLIVFEYARLSMAYSVLGHHEYELI